MDEDAEDEEAGEGEGTDKEYEIEGILDSREIFEDVVRPLVLSPNEIS